MIRSLYSAALSEVSEVMKPSQALAVLAYGTRHMDADLMDRSAEATLAIPARDVCAALAPRSFLAWVSPSHIHVSYF